MRNLLLYASGTLGLVAAFVHGLVGETRVFAHARIEPERLRLLIRGVWHCSAVAWAGCCRPADRCAMDGLADGALLDRRRSRRCLWLWCYCQRLGNAMAALWLGSVDDNSRLGCCRAVMVVPSSDRPRPGLKVAYPTHAISRRAMCFFRSFDLAYL